MPPWGRMATASAPVTITAVPKSAIKAVKDIKIALPPLPSARQWNSMRRAGICALLARADCLKSLSRLVLHKERKNVCVYVFV